MGTLVCKLPCVAVSLRWATPCTLLLDVLGPAVLEHVSMWVSGLSVCICKL